jgi:hypothetical protein
LTCRKCPARSIRASDERPEPASVYEWAASERPPETPRRNFHKSLSAATATSPAVFAADIEPMDARIDAIMTELPPLE